MLLTSSDMELQQSLIHCLPIHNALDTDGLSLRYNEEKE